MVGEHVSRSLLLELFELREPAVRFLEGRGVVRDDAEDIFQDALVAFHEGLDRFDPNFGEERRANGGNGGAGGEGHGNGNGRVPSGNGNGGRPGHDAGHSDGRGGAVSRPDAEVPSQVGQRARHWFWGILRNKTRAHLRGRSRWVHHVPERSEDPPDHFVVRLREILERIHPAEAEILHLRFFEGADLAQLARHCSVSVPTAHRRVRRALEAARDEL